MHQTAICPLEIPTEKPGSVQVHFPVLSTNHDTTESQRKTWIVGGDRVDLTMDEEVHLTTSHHKP
jgi:hypothetical protein